MRQGRLDLLPVLLVATVALAFCAAVSSFYAWRRGLAPAAPSIEPVYDAPELSWRQASFADLVGWIDDDLSEAMAPLALSCARLSRADAAAPANPKEALGPLHDGATLAGAVADWADACAAVRRYSETEFLDPAAANAAARSVLETHFRPVRILATRRAKEGGPTPDAPTTTSLLGKFTGYFEPVYEGAATKSAARSAPALSRPDDLVMVDLGEFREELAGQRIAGRVEKGSLVPYEDRRAIDAGALGRKTRPLVWLDPDEL
ncbi:MAG: MltA domain-containing protein, partial [Parvularculaceae bacterium]|nr:MltA domain-containing protein [Parvularculaceae bacterium]